MVTIAESTSMHPDAWTIGNGDPALTEPSAETPAVVPTRRGAGRGPPALATDRTAGVRHGGDVVA